MLLKFKSSIETKIILERGHFVLDYIINHIKFSNDDLSSKFCFQLVHLNPSLTDWVQNITFGFVDFASFFKLNMPAQPKRLVWKSQMPDFEVDSLLVSQITPCTSEDLLSYLKINFYDKHSWSIIHIYIFYTCISQISEDPILSNIIQQYWLWTSLSYLIF